MEAPKLQLHKAYTILGLPKGAPLSEVRLAYRRLALRYHPDRPGGSVRAFERIERAYSDLRAATEEQSAVPDPESRECVSLTEMQRLGTLLRESSDPSVRLFACRSLANSGRRSAYAYIRNALYDPSELVVLSAVEAVSTLGIRHAYGDLGSVYSRGSERVRLAVLRGIEGSSALEQFRSVVLQALEDPDPEVRRRGLSCFARMRGGKVG
ncbi:MAG: HEAT repeat domain-containing protein [Spirochaetaceae bacterium]